LKNGNGNKLLAGCFVGMFVVLIGGAAGQFAAIQATQHELIQKVAALEVAVEALATAIAGIL
jgi:hypothetical protein